MKQDLTPPYRSFISELVPDWRPTRGQVLWATRFAILLVVTLGILTLIGLPLGITLWNWMDLLIIPVAIAIGGYLFTRSENRAARVAAEQRAQDEALQAYLDQMGQMLLDKEKPLRRAKEDDEVRTLARARTLTVLTRLGSERKRSILQFLSESGLIKGQQPVVSLIGADLSRAHLHAASWSTANLSETKLNGADLSGANLSGGPPELLHLERG